MINITTWSPDTCQCLLHYSWDDSLPQEDRIHTAVEQVTTFEGKIIKRKVCNIHNSLETGPGKHIEHHTKILEENQRKNFILGHILQNSPKLQDVKQNDDGSSTTLFKKGMEPNWSFDASRNLIVTLKGTLTQKEKDDLKTSVIADSKFLKVIMN